MESQFDRSMLGELDQAIANTRNEISKAQTFFWWYILPVSVPTLYRLVQTDTPLWKWLFIPFAFILAFYVVRFGLNKVQLPRMRNLETLRAKLVEDVKDQDREID